MLQKIKEGRMGKRVKLRLVTSEEERDLKRLSRSRTALRHDVDTPGSFWGGWTGSEGNDEAGWAIYGDRLRITAPVQCAWDGFSG